MEIQWECVFTVNTLEEEEVIDYFLSTECYVCVAAEYMLFSVVCCVSWTDRSVLEIPMERSEPSFEGRT